MQHNEPRLQRKEPKDQRITINLTKTQLEQLYDAAERENCHSLASHIRKGLGFDDD